MTSPTEPVASGPNPSAPAPSGPRRPGSLLLGRVGPVRAQLRRALAEAREANRMTTEHEVRALLAERYAAYVDRATGSSDGRALLSAGDKLLELLDTLPIRKVDPAGGGGSGDGGSSRGQLLSIMDGGPQVGDSANA